MAATKGNAGESILDAAEHLFAEHGVEATSTRHIAEACGSRIGTINYHFASKARIVSAVLLRRSGELERVHEQAFSQMIARCGEAVPDLEAVVDAMVTPYLELSFLGGPGWRNYTLLLGRLAFLGDPLLDEIRPVYPEPYYSWFKGALPESCSDRVAELAFDLLSSSIIGACSWHLRQVMPEPGAERRAALGFLLPNVVNYIVNGVRSIVACSEER